jgi:hypothetical protein
LNDDRLIRRIGDRASDRAVGSRSADGLIGGLLVSIGWRPSEEGFDQSMPIVAETKQIPSRRNSSSNSRAQISDGSGRRFFIVCGKNFLVRSTRYHASKQSSGSEAVAAWFDPVPSGVILVRMHREGGGVIAKLTGGLAGVLVMVGWFWLIGTRPVMETAVGLLLGLAGGLWVWHLVDRRVGDRRGREP